MYHLIYKRWTISDPGPETIHVLSFETEEDLSEHIESFEVDEQGGWVYEIIAIIKGERLNMKSQQKFLFESYEPTSENSSSKTLKYMLVLICGNCNYSEKRFTKIACVYCPKCGSGDIEFKDI